MESFENKGKQFNADYLGQNEKEWLDTGDFRVEFITIMGKEICCAIAERPETSNIIFMVGGIPRDQNRRDSLPLINKLYGNLARRLLAIENPYTSVLYNQPATGKSTGDWETETIQSRSEVLTGLTDHFLAKDPTKKVTLMGSSSGGYMTLLAAELLKKRGVAVEKLLLISPAAFPKEVETIPYGPDFSDRVRSHWEIKDSPVWERLRFLTQSGVTTHLTFFEYDDPPIPMAIQKAYQELVEELSVEDKKLSVTIIPGVAHNFRYLNKSKPGDIINNASVRETSIEFVRLLTNPNSESTK